MKIHQEQIDIERVGVQTENSFTIKTSAAAFDILSAGLYTDPIAAIIRELSCNAYDSHVAANKVDTPFQIHLPNSLEPFLSIRDFGIGLSDDDVLHLYTTYFESTKTDSNDFIGARGLGSKSPFSYSKSYEVISRFDGVVRSYHMFINEHGIPDVVKMYTNPTSDENGLEVKIGIDPSDFSQVLNKTAATLKHFTVKPTIVGALHFEFDKLPTNTIDGDDWMAYDSSTSHYNTKFTVVQGNVQYKVNMNQMRDDLTNDELSFFNHMHMVGYFNIGDLDTAANREEIRYDPQTKKVLVKFIRRVLKEITSIVIDRCGNYDTYWEACAELDKLSSNIFGHKSALYSIIQAADITNPMLARYVDQQGLVQIPKMLKRHSIYTYQMNRSWTKKVYSRERTVKEFEPTSSTVILLNDVKSGGVARMIAYGKDHPEVSRFMLITSFDWIFSEADKIDTPNHADYPQVEYDEIVEAMGHPKVHSLSELCPRIKKEKVPRTFKAFSYSHMDWIGYHRRVVWKKFDVDIDSGGIFFVLKHGSSIFAIHDKKEKSIHWETDSTESNIKHLAKLVNHTLGEDKYNHHDVRGVSISTYNKIKNDPNWINAFEVIKDGLYQVADQITTIHRTNASIGCFGVINSIKNTDCRDELKKLLKTSTFKNVTAEAVADWNVIGFDAAYYSFCSKMHNQLNINTTNVDVKPYFTYNDFEKYSMFPILETLPTEGPDFSKVVDYITLMDEQK